MTILFQNLLIGILLLSAVIYIGWHLIRSRQPGDACVSCHPGSKSHHCPHLVKATKDCPTEASKARRNS